MIIVMKLLKFDKFLIKLSKIFKKYVENYLKNEEFKFLFW